MKTIKITMGFVVAATVLAVVYAAFGGDGDRYPELRLEAVPGRAYCAAGDTVVVGVKASIPQGYHLYSNPLGPGIGKPFNLFVNQRNKDKRVRLGAVWVDARKSFPKRYTPPIGSWVWAYESEAYFFVKGVMAKDSAAAADTVDTAAAAKKADAPAVKGKPPVGVGKNKKAAAAAVDTIPPLPSSLVYEVILEALMCQSACIPIAASASFELRIPADTGAGAAPAANTGKSDGGVAFPTSSSWQLRYAKSEPVAFRTGAPESAASVQDGADASGVAAGISGAPGAGGIDLSGLSGLSAAPAVPTEPPPDGAPAAADDWQYGAAAAADADGGEAYNYYPLEEKREYTIITAILFALLAGLALNLTPCIFPMLSVRVLSFAESALESRRSAVVRSVFFSLGIVAVFLLLAGLAAFAGFSWGQQFQNPGMMVGIIAIVFLFALGMFSFYTLPVPAALSGAGRKSGSALLGDFLKGAAATVMATPCGGPFLGALLAWALLQKPLTIFVLFAAMGVGMALPYVALASSKRLMGLLPKPGRWIEDLKHFMGFLLLAFAVNMMRSLDPRLVATAVGVCLSILIAASVNKRFTQFGMPAARRAVVAFASIALLAAGTAVSVAYLRIDIQIFNDDQAIGATPSYWSEFSPQALKAANEEKCNAIVNFTASWCTNCKLNKAAVLNSEAAKKLYNDKNVLLLTADITNDNPEAQELLRHLGSRSVPFLAIFPGDAPKNPIIMRDILSREKFLAELRNLP